MVVTFSKRVTTASVTADTFTVANGAPVDGTVTVAGNRRSATFTPAGPLDHETEYTVSLTDGVVDGAGNPLVAFESVFTTEEPDLTPPQVVTVSPPNGDDDVTVDTDVVVTFSEPIDAGTVGPASFTLSNGAAVAGSVNVAGNGLSATFSPDADLAFDTGHTVSLTSAVTDLAGNSLPAFASSFTTASPAPDPGVPVVTAIRVDDGPSHDGTGNDSRGNNDGVRPVRRDHRAVCDGNERRRGDAHGRGCRPSSSNPTPS